LWKEYSEGKQTYRQLSEKYGVSIKTIQRKLDSNPINKDFIFPNTCVLLIDTTYFGRNFGVMLFKTSEGQNVYWKYVKYETNALYAEGIAIIREHGTKIKGIVCDGRRGLFNTLSEYPIQMCQFHQVAIVTRYITRRPKHQAGIELKDLVHLMCKTDKESFFGAMDEWYEKWKLHISERSVNPITGKSWYTHKRLRSAYKSLERNKEYLFTWYDKYELKIPNTNNKLEGSFTNLKNNLRNHNGLNRKRKEKFIDGFLKASSPKIEEKKAGKPSP
jgi:hypothetical protein